MAKKEKQRNHQERTQERASSERLVVELPERIMARLRILAENSDLATAISDAVLLLWGQHYPQSAALPTESGTSDPQARALTQQRRDKAYELHAKGVPLEDIAAEMDWSVEAVRSALGIQEQPTPLAADAEREALRQQISALRDQGASYSDIAKQLNADGVATLSGSGKWHHGTVKRFIEIIDRAAEQ